MVRQQMENNLSTQIEESTISIFIPMKIKKRGGNVATIITPANKQLRQSETSNYDFRLINALAKAYKLQKKMINNSTFTVASLAAKEGLTRSYLGRILRLNLLAPDIIETILAGKQPRELRLIDFLRQEIPFLWEEQREKFGFT